MNFAKPLNMPRPARVLTTAVTGCLMLAGWPLKPSLAAEPRAAADGWIELFDGKTLRGWHKNPQKIVHGTGGIWTVEPGGVLAGEQDPPGSGNGGILLTDRKFGDFELSIDMKPHWGSDSGVFLRRTTRASVSRLQSTTTTAAISGTSTARRRARWVARAFSIEGNVKNGQLVGLKAIDARPPAEVGLVASCSPEEWLKAWKVGDWNTALIRVEGGNLPVITTYINGIKVGVFDAATSMAEKYDREEVAKLLGDQGSIAVQVHGGESYPPGAKCRWRNIRIREL